MSLDDVLEMFLGVLLVILGIAAVIVFVIMCKLFAAGQHLSDRAKDSREILPICPSLFNERERS